LLFAAAMALCAFALPTTAGAISWDPLGTNQTVTSPDVGFTTNLPGLLATVSSCTSSSFGVTVNAAASQNLEVTTATFGGHCVTTFSPSGASCTTTARGTSFPWTITALSTSNVRLDGVHIDVVFHQTAGLTCPATLVGQSITITGSTTSGGSWNPGTDELILSNAEGLQSHSPLTGTTPITARGTFTDAVAPRLDLTD
jgi:hypothetical protein